MDDEERIAAENSLMRVEREQNLSREDQMVAFTTLSNLASQQIEAAKFTYGRTIDLLQTRDNNRVEMAKVELEERESKRRYKQNMRTLDIIEKTLSAHFAERQQQIKEGFRLIDKALEQNNWDAALVVFKDMSNMVASSPLAGLAEFKSKMRSGSQITLDDF